jgi:ABC-type spermidine/putrescine transport system permease subunit II
LLFFVLEIEWNDPLNLFFGLFGALDKMNKAFIIIAIPAIVVATGYFLMAAYFGAHLTYYRIFIAAILFLLALYFVKKYQKKKSSPKVGG